jgi:hypothetical protein
MEKPYWRKKFPISTTRLSFGNDLCAVANLAGDPKHKKTPSYSEKTGQSYGRLFMKTQCLRVGRKPRVSRCIALVFEIAHFFTQHSPF